MGRTHVKKWRLKWLRYWYRFVDWLTWRVYGFSQKLVRWVARTRTAYGMIPTQHRRISEDRYSRPLDSRR